VLLFFLSQLIAIINWTNIGEVIATKLITFMGGLEFSGAPLIIMLFIITILIGILIPSTLSKWMLMSPLIVPLFMRSNITPDFTQLIFKSADGIGKAITPLYIYFIIMVGFVQSYWENKKVTILGMYKLIMPTILITAGLLILIVIGWFIIGLPLGPITYPTL
jgi:aminobenzoyl-glutamate transport protein